MGSQIGMRVQVKVLGALLEEEMGLPEKGANCTWRPPGVASDHKEVAVAR